MQACVAVCVCASVSVESVIHILGQGRRLVSVNLIMYVSMYSICCAGLVCVSCTQLLTLAASRDPLQSKISH